MIIQKMYIISEFLYTGGDKNGTETIPRRFYEQGEIQTNTGCPSAARLKTSRISRCPASFGWMPSVQR